MNSNTLYAAAMVGRQADYDDQIIKEAWEEDGYNNMAELKAQDACEAAYEAHGADVYGKCRAAGISCGSDAGCDAVFLKYAKALKKGYKGSFADFKKRSKNLAAIGTIGLDFIGGLLGKIGSGRDGGEGGGDYGAYGGYAPPQKSRTGLYIGLGLVAVVGVGVAIYFANKKK